MVTGCVATSAGILFAVFLLCYPAIYQATLELEIAISPHSLPAVYVFVCVSFVCNSVVVHIFLKLELFLRAESKKVLFLKQDFQSAQG